MADEDDDEDDQDAGGGDDEGGEPPEKGGKKVLIIIGLLFLIVIGGLAAAYFTGLTDPVIEMVIGTNPDAEGGEDGEQSGQSQGRAVFYDLQELLVNLNTGGRKSSFLKIRVSLELQSEDDRAKLDTIMPRIIDNFQTYLRELRIDDLKGSAGMYRLREELLLRVNAAAAPAKIKDVLFKEMLIQ